VREGSYSAQQALARLVAGNQRFVRGKARFPTLQKEVLADLVKAQRPYATVLGCSDSRVPPELVFDAGFGELFVVRVAGNVISPEIMGTPSTSSRPVACASWSEPWLCYNPSFRARSSVG
jgi:carbonic anhydrase